jgi:aspartate/methionine/tyrosine aminotransferase
MELFCIDRNSVCFSDWIDKFFSINRSRLKAARDYVVEKLAGLGIETLPSQAAFFVLADFRKVDTRITPIKNYMHADELF